MYALQFVAPVISPADGEVRHMGVHPSWFQDVEGPVPPARTGLAGTVIAAAISVMRITVAPDPVDQVITFALMVQGAANALGTVASSGGAGPVEDFGTFEGLAIAVAANDSLRIRATFPTWITTNPTDLYITGTLWIRDTAEQAAIDLIQANLDAHIADAVAAHAASAISNAPAGTIAATTVQAAVDEIASEYGTADATLQTLIDAIETEIGEPFPTSRLDALETLMGAGTLDPNISIAEAFLRLRSAGVLKPVAGEFSPLLG